MIIYLHHDQSIFKNIFCDKTLCDERVSRYLRQNFVVWPWDVTFPNNRARLLTNVNKQHTDISNSAVGNTILSRFRHLQSPDELPLMLILIKIPSQIPSMTGSSGVSIFDEVKPSHNADELFVKLKDAFEAYRAALGPDIAKECTTRLPFPMFPVHSEIRP